MLTCSASLLIWATARMAMISLRTKPLMILVHSRWRLERLNLPIAERCCSTVFPIAAPVSPVLSCHLKYVLSCHLKSVLSCRLKKLCETCCPTHTFWPEKYNPRPKPTVTFPTWKEVCLDCSNIDCKISLYPVLQQVALP